MKRLVEINLPSTMLYIEETDTTDFAVKVDLLVNGDAHNYASTTSQNLLDSLVVLTEFYNSITKYSLCEDNLFVNDECILSAEKILNLINEGKE